MKTNRILMVFTVLLFAALACQTSFRPNSQLPNSQPPVVVPTNPPPISVQAPVNPAAEQDAFTALYQRVSQGVVAIQVVTTQGAALGSGIVYDTDGHIITNYHVVQGANGNQAEVDFMSGFKTYGTVVGTDLDSDLAILKVDAPASELHPLTFGDSAALQVGQTVVANREPVRLRRYDDGRCRLCPRPHARLGTYRAGRHPTVHSRRPDPDRRGHQSRQFRRPIIQHERRSDRHQSRHSDDQLHIERRAH